MSVKKIAFVSDAIYPYNKGGKETRLYEITTRLAARGYDVHVYCMKWWNGAANRVENGVHLHGICPHIPLYDGPRRSIKQGILFGLSCFKLMSESFDVIDVDHMPFFPLFSVRIVCWLKGKKMYATWHEVWGTKYWQKYVGTYKGLIASLIEKTSAKLPDTIFTVSQLTAQRLKDQLGYTGHLVIIPNGIDLESIKSTKKSSQNSDVIFAGRLLSHKNVDILIHATAKLKQTHPQIQVIIVGEGPEKSNLEHLTKELHLESNVTFMLFKDDINELYSLMKASKVFVLPSVREGFGLVVLEANACGIPVVVIDHHDNATKELIDDNSGRLTELSSTAISKQITYFLDKHQYITNWEKIEKYSWNSILDSFVNKY